MAPEFKAKGFYDTNVTVLVSNNNYVQKTYRTRVRTAQVAPSVLKLLGLKPWELDAVRAESTVAQRGF